MLIKKNEIFPKNLNTTTNPIGNKIQYCSSTDKDQVWRKGFSIPSGDPYSKPEK